MISTMEDIGKLFLKLDDVIEFKNEFDKLYSLVNHNNMFFYNFFHSSLSDRINLKVLFMHHYFSLKSFQRMLCLFLIWLKHTACL